MKLTKISIACAAALVSGQVMAHAPGTVADETIYISGASAQDKALKTLVTSLCKAGTLDTFRNGTSGKDYTSYFCTIDAAVAGITADKKVLINKRSAGGSGKGVQVVADSVPIEAMNINNGNCVETAVGSRLWDCDISGGVAGNDLFMKVSTAGISDVEPAMFTGLNVPAGDQAVTPVQIGKMDITTMNAVIFGVPLSTHLYRALQVAQGLDDTKDDEANMPSLSSAQVNGLITGAIGSWNKFLVNGTPLSTVAGVTPPANTTVHICRRTPGSGTQAQMNAVFANAPCAAGVKEPALAPGNPFTGPLVYENAESGEVTTCLADLDNLNKWALGVQSLEKLSPNFRFPKIDGVAPTLANVANNTYRDWVETSMQWRKTQPVGDVLTLLKKIAKDASTPATIASLNASYVHGFGTGAYLALNTNGHAPSFPFNPALPVTTATHAPLGTPNTCNFPVVNVTSDFN